MRRILVSAFIFTALFTVSTVGNVHYAESTNVQTTSSKGDFAT